MKKTVIFPFFLTIFLLFAGCNGKSQLPGPNDIITFRNNNSHTGVFQSKAFEHPDGFRWIFNTNGPVRSTPSVFNNTVLFGSSDGNFYAVNLENGKEKWKFNSGGAIQSSPSISGNKIYFSSRNGRLYALDVTTGNEIWSFDLGGDIPLKWGFDYYLSSPVVNKNNLFVGSGNGKFYSIDANNGKVIWEYDCGSRVRSTAAISDNYILFGDMNGRFYALDRKKGSLIWKFDVEGIKYDNSKFGFDRRAIMSSASVSGSNVVFGSRDGNLYNLDLQTGKELWKVSHGTSWIITSPAIYNGVVYEGSSDAHFVQAVDLKSGKEIWNTKTKQAVWSSPAVTENEMYYGDFSGTLYSVDLKTGDVKWKYNILNAFIASSPVVAEKNILVGGDDGNLYCIKGNDKINSTESFKRAVYWEESKSFNWFHNGVDEGIKNYFQANNYEVLDKNSLAKFLKVQINSKSLSVVVFATNKVPYTIFDEKENNYLLKEYLESNGKIVFLGANPMGYIFDKKTGKLTGIDFGIPSKILGVDYKGELTDAMKGWFYARATPEGKKWGLTGWWVGIASVDTNQVSKVLAIDETGNAAAWVKNYGGPEGTGLVQLWVNRSDLPDLTYIKLVAEYGL